MRNEAAYITQQAHANRVTQRYLELLSSTGIKFIGTAPECITMMEPIEASRLTELWQQAMAEVCDDNTTPKTS